MSAKKLALELLLLTATRTSEVLKARWQEFDLRGATWAIPADRTKTSREHRVPLSAAAVDVLRRAQTALGLAGPGDLVFPDNRDRRKPITPDGLQASHEVSVQRGYTPRSAVVFQGLVRGRD